ncbi:hypothetical protein AB832_04265 [Flavobacteriaceae bacterium (ex Bugula neritina AB1)]|nr:hypothetical protein AB832_04265 [Flavobacteriaceae bacterium (ex Bugula neritina AB1)]
MKTIVILFFFLFSIISYNQDIALQTFSNGFIRPLAISNAGDSRLFIVEQAGLIKILNSDGTVNSTPFIDLSSFIIQEPDRQNEQGLLGLAFHPNYSDPSNGYFYVNYTAPNGNTVISRFKRDATNNDLGDNSSELKLLEFPQPFTNHNGGHLEFGPDNKLYISSGDGGSGGDPGDRAQNINLLLGKILRLDVDIPSPYIPSDNPFVGITGADEIWAYGLRNPWKFSFDNQTNDLWIADVGQQNIEEVNKVPASLAGVNYGWRCFEGSQAFNSSGNCPTNNNDLTFPVSEYSHTNSGQFKCSITGGYVYRGSQFPTMQGKYIFADYCSNQICLVENSGGTITYFNGIPGAGIATFGTDINNELYTAGRDNGIIYKVVDQNLLSIPENTPASVTLYPNPAYNFINIDISKKISTIVIYDLTGKIVQQNNSLEPDSYTYNVSSLPSGPYFVKIIDINQNTLNRKIIIE